MDIVNFAEETIKALNNHLYNVDDIAWIGTRDFQIPIDEFFDVARCTLYDSGYGKAEMPTDLIIVMRDKTWFSRAEYDGSEWWQFNKPPTKKPKLINHIVYYSFDEVSYDQTPKLHDACVRKGQSMKCPKCKATEDIKFFLRHQDTEDDTSDNANVITMLCTKCGYNQSFFLVDCLDAIFPEWSETPSNFGGFDFSNFPVDLFNSGMSEGFPEDNFDFDDMIEGPATKED